MHNAVTQSFSLIPPSAGGIPAEIVWALLLVVSGFLYALGFLRERNGGGAFAEYVAALIQALRVWVIFGGMVGLIVAYVLVIPLAAVGIGEQRRVEIAEFIMLGVPPLMVFAIGPLMFKLRPSAWPPFTVWWSMCSIIVLAVYFFGGGLVVGAGHLISWTLTALLILACTALPAWVIWTFTKSFIGVKRGRQNTGRNS